MNSLTTNAIELNPLSEQAINLPPEERLRLLLKTKHFPIATKRSSAKRQIEEMTDLYDFCSVIIARYFPDEDAEDNFFATSFLTSIKYPMRLFANKKLGKAFQMLGAYEKWEDRITAIQQLFLEYEKTYPQLYEKYNLEELATEKISTIVWRTRDELSANPDLLFEVMDRWELR